MKALVKNELRLTRKLLLIWMGIVLILCGFAYFEYLSLKESLNELTGLISNFPKILKAMFGVSGDLTSALGWYGCMYYWVTMLTNSYAVYLGVSCVAKEQAQGRAKRSCFYHHIGPVFDRVDFVCNHASGRWSD